MLTWARIHQSLEAGQRCALVTVVDAQGSAPREAGARLVVQPDGGFFGTIGGGTLEWQALAAAQGDLAGKDSGVRLRDYGLGPELGQCCGGRVRLLFEVFGPAARQAAGRLAELEARGLFATRARFSEAGLEREVRQADIPIGRAKAMAALQGQELCEVFGDDRRPLLLFGAGHVGRALVLALAPLPFRITWIDPRAEAFPAAMPASATARVLKDPVAALTAAPEGAFVLVMTHSHPLDLEIVGAALRDGRFGYLGLIGSKTKRARFEKRLAEAGLGPEVLARLVCPIGACGIASKAPAAIAAAVAVELLRHDEARRAELALDEGAGRFHDRRQTGGAR